MTSQTLAEGAVCDGRNKGSKLHEAGNVHKPGANVLCRGHENSTTGFQTYECQSRASHNSADGRPSHVCGVPAQHILGPIPGQAAKVFVYVRENEQGNPVGALCVVSA